jgi:hypothetical protein
MQSFAWPETLRHTHEAVEAGTATPRSDLWRTALVCNIDVEVENESEHDPQT